MRRSLLSAALGAAVFAAACADEPPTPTAPLPAPLFSQQAQGLQDRYIVVLRSDVGNPDVVADDLVGRHGGQIHRRYRAALKGFAATLPAAALEGIRRSPAVDYVEADGVVTTVGSQSNPPSWGLDRVDQQALPLDDLYTWENEGSGVDVYIIDTGIRMDHQEYAGRAVSGWDFVDDDPDASDCDGHGTHVAGTVGGSSVGIAKSATLIGVRVLNCQGSGSYSDVIAGIDWVTANHSGPSVANMSLGGGFSSSVNQAVQNSVAAGVVHAVAAGNSNADACTRSPASAPDALTIGSSTASDARSSFSNWGSCVDVFAPGSSITSSTQGSTSSYGTWSGTSMASPHAAGVAALYLGANPSASPAQVESAMLGGATSGALSGIGSGSPNLLLYSLIAGGGGEPPPPPPPPPSDPELHVGGLDGSTRVKGKKGWSATLEVTVHDAGHATVEGVTVDVKWGNGRKANGSCVTDATGRCSVSVPKLSNNDTQVTMQVTGLSGPGATYDASANHPDPPEVTLIRP